MNVSLLAGLLLASSRPAAAPLPAPARIVASEGIELAQVTFHSRIVVRIEAARTAPPPVTRWVEKKGPHCIEMADILGSGIIVANSVDLAMRGGGRTRIRFERSCPGLDYYSGFYVVPNRDGKICAERDVVRDRAGSECAIDKFRKLVPAK